MYTIIQTYHPKPFDPLERSQRKRSIATHPGSDDTLKRPRKMTRPLTPSTASEDEGSIHHELAERRLQHAQGMEKPSGSTENFELLQTHIPSSSREFRSLSIRQSIAARTPEPEDPVGEISRNNDTRQGASDTMKDSEDVMPADVPPADRSNTTAPSQHFKETHTTFIFIDRSTGTRHARDFSVCNSLRELFWFVQLTNTITPGSSRCALALTIGSTTKRVGQGKDEAGFREMLEAIWNSRCWEAGEEAKCEVRVRELVLA